MSKFIATGLFLLAVCLPSPAGAVGKITVDPNAGPSKASVKTISTTDVIQKVTYEAKRKTVLSILTDLSKMTGVKLYAGYNNEDWQVRDRRMNIFAKELPLSNLMNSIARVMKFKWSKSENDAGVVSYRLYMDRDILLGAERQRYIEEDKLEKRQAEARQEFLPELEEASGMSENDLHNLKMQSPYVYAMVKRGWAGMFAGLLAEVPTVRQAWLAGQEQALNIGSLSPALQLSITKCLRQSDPIDQGTLTLNCSDSLGSDDLGSLGNLTVHWGSNAFETGFLDPESDFAKAVANFWGAAGMLGPDDKADKSEIARLHEEVNRTLASNPTDLKEPVTEHLDDPTLSAKMKMNVEGDDFADILAALGKSSNFAIVSDSFRRQIPGFSFPEKDIPLRTLLDKLASACRDNWERHGSILEFHDRDWFRKRAAQIPDAWLETWRKVLRDNGSLDIRELSQIAVLTDDQDRVNALPDEILGGIGLDRVVFGGQDLLRLYAKLDTQQQALMFTQQGLSLNAVTDDQLQALQKLLQPYSSDQGGLRLLGTKEKNGKQTTYTFRVVTSSGDATDLKWKIKCPVYDTSKEKPKDAQPQQTQGQGTKQ